MTPPRDRLEDLAGIPDPLGQTEGETAPLPSPPVVSSVASPTRPQQARRQWQALGVAIAWQVLWIVAIEHRADAAVAPSAIVLGIVVPLAAAAIAWRAGTAGGNFGLGWSPGAIATAALGAPLLFALATLAFDPADNDPSARAFLNRAARCVLVTALLCAPSIGLVVFAFRRAFVAASRWRTASLGVACGALAAASMTLVRPHGEALHVLIGHGLMMVVGGAVGALLGRSVTRA